MDYLHHPVFTTTAHSDISQYHVVGNHIFPFFFYSSRRLVTRVSKSIPVISQGLQKSTVTVNVGSCSSIVPLSEKLHLLWLLAQALFQGWSCLASAYAYILWILKHLVFWNYNRSMYNMFYVFYQGIVVGYPSTSGSMACTGVSS